MGNAFFSFDFTILYDLCKKIAANWQGFMQLGN